MRASWKEWVIRVALVTISLGGVWALWGPEIVDALSPPVEHPPAAPPGQGQGQAATATPPQSI